MGLFVRLMICLVCAGLILYKYIDKSNELTKVRLLIPMTAKELKEIQEKNLELEYAIECFENPLHFMDLARQPEFGYLKYPSLDAIVILSDVSLKSEKEEEESPCQ